MLRKWTRYSCRETVRDLQASSMSNIRAQPFLQGIDCDRISVDGNISWSPSGLLAVDFDDAEGIPRPNWRWEEQELAFRWAGSSLIAIVHAGPSRVVQFSHISVKEFFDFASPRHCK